MNDHGRPNRLQTDHPSPPPLRQPQDVTHVHHHEYFSPVVDRTRISLATLESGKQIWRLRTQRSRRLESLTRRQLRLFQYLDQEHPVRNCNPKHSSVSWEGELGDRQTNENVVTPDSPLTLDDVSSNYEEGQSQITEASILEERPHCGPSGILNFHEVAEKFHKISCDIPSIHLGISNQCIWLDFGGAEINRVGKIRSLSFLAQAPAHNRNDTIQTTDACVYPVEFEFDSFPFESGFDVSMIDPTSKHSSSEDLHPPVGVQLREGEFKQFFITWNPIKLGGVREVIHLTTPGGMNQIVVVGNAGNNECDCLLQETENRISDLIEKEVSLDVRNVIVRGNFNDDGRRNSGHRHLDNPDVIVTDSQVDGHDAILSDYEISATSAPNDENIANHTSMTSESIIHNNSSDADSHRDERSTHDNIKTNAEGDGLRIQKKMGHDGGKDGESGLHLSNSISLNGKETNSDISDVNGSCYESQDDTSGKFVEAINVSRSGSDCTDVNNECKTSEKEVDVDEIYHHDVGRQCLVGAHVDDVGASRDKLADQSFDYPELDYVGGNAEKYETAGEVTDTGICTDVHSTYSSECRVDGTGTMPNGHDNDSSKSVHSQTDPSSSIDVSKINDLLPNGEIEDEEGNDDSSDNLSCEFSNGSYSQKRSYEIDSRCFKYVETRPLDQKTLAEPVEEGSLYLQTMTFVDSLIGDATVADESHFSELESLTNESVHKVQTVKDQVQNNDGEYKQEVQLNKHFTFNFETCDNQESNELMLEDKDEKEDQGQADAPSCESAGSDSDESIIPRDISAMVLEMEKELQDVTDFVSMTGDTPKSKTLPLEDDYSDSEEEVDSVPQGLGRTFSNDSSAHLIMLNDQVADDLLLHSNRDDVHVDHYAFETTEKSADVGSASLKTQTTPKNEDALNSNLCSSTLHDCAAASIPATSSVSSPMANASPLVSIKTDSQSNHKISSLSDIAMENKHVSSAKQPIKAPESPRTITRKTARMYYFYKSPKEDSTKKKKNKKKRVNPNNRSPLFSSDKAIEQRIDTKHYDELSLKRKRDFIVHQRSLSLEPSFNGAERRVHSRLSATPSSTTSVKKTSETTRKQNYAENGAGMETEKLQHDAAESNQQQHTKSNTLTDQPTTEVVDSDREQTRSNYHDALESNPVNATTSGASLNNTPISINKNRNKLRSKRFSTPHYSSKSKDFNVGVLSDTKTSRKSFSPSHLATLKFENPMSAMISEIVTESAQSCYFYRPPEKTVSKGTSSRHLRSPRVPRTSFEDSTASSRAKIIPDTPYAKLKYGQGSVKHLSLHSRCEVQPGSRRGEIAYIGAIDELGGGGYWVGVILDEPVGKTDGTVQSSGVRYFEAPGSRRGGFFRGKNVEVGDFPCIDVINELDGVDE